MGMIGDKEEFCKILHDVVEDQADALWEALNGEKNAKGFDIALRQRGGEMLRMVCGEVLSTRGRVEREGREITCACGGKAVFKQYRPQTVETILPGKFVRFRAAYYECPTCNNGTTPVLARLGIGSDRMTLGLREMVVLAGTVETYEAASRDLLNRMADVELSDVQVRRAVCGEAKSVEEHLDQARPSGDEKARPSEIVVGIDGGMVHVDGKWHEAKLACIYEKGDRVQVSPKRGELIGREVTAVLGDREDLAKKLWSRVEAMKAEEANVVLLRDGAPWIHNLAADLFPRRVEILDWHHAVEHINDCARTLYGESPEGSLSDRAKEWSKAQLDRLWDDGVDDVLQGLRFLMARQKTARKTKAIQGLTRYIEENREAMRYRTFRDLRYPVGSGFVESAIHHVVQLRMKRPGCRWDRPGAGAVLSLRCLYRSIGRWDEYWAKRRKAA